MGATRDQVEEALKDWLAKAAFHNCKFKLFGHGKGKSLRYPPEMLELA